MQRSWFYIFGNATVLQRRTLGT